MIRYITVFCVLIFAQNAFSQKNPRAQKVDSLATVLNYKDYTSKELKANWGIYDPVISPFNTRQGNRLWITSGIMVGVSAFSYGILYLMPESVTNWDKDDMTFQTMTDDWLEHVKEGPVWDEDDWFLNWVMHPYFGALYYNAARGAGYQWYWSFGFSALMSTCFWEYGIEAFAEVPSAQDLLITPIVGSMLGEAFHIAKKGIIKNNYYLLGSRGLGKVTMFLMDPFNELYDGFVRRQVRRHMSTQTEFQSFISPNTQVGGVNIGFTLKF